MPRPRKCRMIGFIPHNPSFHPQVQSQEEVVLTLEELESMRLSDLLELGQDEGADSMSVSRGTFQRILNAARQKVADALVHGKTLRIDGGDYQFVRGGGCCKRHGRSSPSEQRKE